MRTFSKSPKIVKKLASPPKVPPEMKNVTGTTEKAIASKTSVSNLPLNTKMQSTKHEIKVL